MISRKMSARLVLSAAITVGAMLQTASAADQECPAGDLPVSATVEGHMTTVGFIVGARWGEGTLTLADGSQHKFTAQGAKLLETGAAKVTFKGKVYNLQKMEDFEGNYGAISGGLTVIKGLTGGAVLTNDKCVYINVEGESEGVRLSAPAPGGVMVHFEDW
jgi:outer membrane immunogenic protein